MQISKAKKGYKFVKSIFKNNIELPENWEQISIDQCCKILDSKRIPLNESQRKLMIGDIPYYGANGVQGYINKHIFDQDLILVAEDGGNFYDYQNRPIAYLINGKSWVNNHAHVLSPKTSYDLKWIFYSLVHKNVIPWINGTTRSKLNQSELKKIIINLPPLHEQQKISSILLNVDDALEKIDHLILKTKSLKKGMMQKYLTKGIGHTKFKKVKWFFGKEIEIPEEWEMEKIIDVSDNFISGGTPSTQNNEFWNGDIPWIRSPDLDKKEINKSSQTITEKGLRNSSAKIVSKNNVIISTRVSLGKISINRIDVAINQDLLGVILDKERISEEFTYWFLKQNSNFLINFSQGSTIKGIIGKDVKNMKIFVPSLFEQKQITSILSNIDSQINKEKLQKSNLELLKKGLMQKLLPGQIRVKV
jgi:type I restriction enzyme, S subunit